MKAATHTNFNNQSEDQLWNEIRSMVLELDADPLKQNVQSFSDLVYIYRNRLESAKLLEAKQLRKLQDNRTLLQRKFAQKIVLYYSDELGDRGHWVIDFLMMNKRKTALPPLHQTDCNINKDLLVDYLFYRVESLDELPELFKRYQDKFNNCDVYLIVDEHVPVGYECYIDNVVNNAGDLIRK